MALNLYSMTPGTEMLGAITLPCNYEFAPFTPSSSGDVLRARCGDRRLAGLGGIGMWGVSEEPAMARVVNGRYLNMYDALVVGQPGVQDALHPTCAADDGAVDILEATLDSQDVVSLTEILVDRLGHERRKSPQEWSRLYRAWRGGFEANTRSALEVLRQVHQPGEAIERMKQKRGAVIIPTPDASHFPPPAAVVVDTSGNGSVLKAGIADGTVYHHNGNTLHASRFINSDRLAMAAQGWVASTAVKLAKGHNLPLVLAHRTDNGGRRLEQVSFS